MITGMQKFFFTMAEEQQQKELLKNTDCVRAFTSGNKLMAMVAERCIPYSHYPIFENGFPK